ncbi:MAG TPA: PSD1 and planctomycete cytochrome C domain-containing protein, partial [Chthoniobacteraceae bacterium]|nr:PSD1 and planctomycete cytochrome C domain-containing protein [Chthoniobacteraceae bacterium]
FFEKKIRPVLAEQCFKCHSASGEKIKGGLVLDSREAILKGGDSGPGLVPGDIGKSLIIQAVRYTDEDLQMPPKHRLHPEQVADLEEWVKMGVPDPREGAAPPAAYTVDLEEARKFWSFQPVQDPAVPAVKGADWARNEIDRFLLAKLEEKQLAPNPDLDRGALLRRATYDLTGLPPTPEEVREFLADSSPDAFAKTIERLLASPAYGERWGRHWLDVVRYADTSGCNSDFPIPSAHRYRDYVVKAVNQDKPYDAFLREQIAGDLLPAASDEERFEKTIATGYLAIARRFGSRANEFHLTVEDLIDNLGKATLGLSVSCARCHDHKFDPVLNKDYYALYGIFDSSRFAFPGTEIYRHTKDFVPLVADRELAEKYLAEGRELAGLDDRVENLKNEKKRLAREEKESLEKAPPPPELTDTDKARIRAALEAKAAASRRTAGEPEAPISPAPPVQPTPPVKTKRTAADAQRDLDAALARQAELVQNADAYPKAYAVMEGQPRNARIQRKGDPGNKGDEVPRGFLTVLGAQTLPAEEKGSGRRQLADWIADAKNPLTARVMVNRIWQGHFGRGLVRTPNDFGLRGERPTHPELLDWLASRFVESGWSVKALHRTIMLSRAYQMSSEERPEAAAIDTNNDLFWRFNRRRLSAEEVRDSFLAIAGTLDRGPAGPHPFPPEKQWRYTQHRPFVADYETDKRSIYLMQQRIKKQPFLEVFDGADANASTAVRPLSHTPIQALWMMNAGLAHDQSLKLAERLESTFSDEAARLALAFELVFGRSAAPDEIEQGRAYLRELGGALADTAVPPELHGRTALASFTRVLLSSNEFLFVE